jgi:uncharacterized glyoxalase superfamily protein PhnB
MSAKPIPDGYHSVTPYLCVKGAAQAIEFYKKAFLATERMRIAQPDGRVGHAELQVGDSVIMLSDEFPVSCSSYAALPTRFNRVNDAKVLSKSLMLQTLAMTRKFGN